MGNDLMVAMDVMAYGHRVTVYGNSLSEAFGM